MNQNPALVPYTVRVKGAVSVGYPSKFTLYALEVFTPKTDFVLFRRYSELRDFYSSTLEFAPIVRADSPKFPASKAFGGNDAAVVNARKRELTEYFQDLTRLANQHAGLRRALNVFLEATQLHRYAFTDDLEALSFFVNVDKQDASTRDAAYGTPLHYAAAQGHDRVVEFLLQQGASPTARDMFGNTPLELARRRGHMGVYQLLRTAEQTRATSSTTTASDASAVGTDDTSGRDARASSDVSQEGTYIPPQYNVLPDKRRILVLVNPFGGRKLARALWTKLAKPVFDLSGLRTTAIETTRAGHAADVVKELNLEQYDGILSISGDGLLAEIINALAARPDGEVALRTPVAILAGGSGNGLAWSTGFGSPVDGVRKFLHGLYRPLDLLYVDQPSSKQQRHCFLSVAWGLMSDLDFESEPLRWMGDFRFTLTALSKILKKKKYDAKLTYVPANDAQDAISLDIKCGRHCKRCALSYHPTLNNEPVAASAQAATTATPAPETTSAPRCAAPPEDEAKVPVIPASDEKGGAAAPVGAAAPPDGHNHVGVEDHLNFFICMNVPHAAEASVLAPYAHCSDGCMDLLMLRGANRTEMIDMMTAMETGVHIKHPKAIYLKVKSFTLEPKSRDTLVDLDGERFPNETIHVTVKPSAATVAC